jgi:hypothetical protein
MKKYGIATLLLMLLVGVRALAQFIIATTSQVQTYRYVYAIIGILYVAIFIGLIIKKKWAAIAMVAFALIDLVAALWIGGVSAIGAGVLDLLIGWLAYLTFKKDN